MKKPGYDLLIVNQLTTHLKNSMIDEIIKIKVASVKTLQNRCNKIIKKRPKTTQSSFFPQKKLTISDCLQLQLEVVSYPSDATEQAIEGLRWNVGTYRISTELCGWQSLTVTKVHIEHLRTALQPNRTWKT